MEMNFTGRMTKTSLRQMMIETFGGVISVFWQLSISKDIIGPRPTDEEAYDQVLDFFKDSSMKELYCALIDLREGYGPVPDWRFYNKIVLWSNTVHSIDKPSIKINAGDRWIVWNDECVSGHTGKAAPVKSRFLSNWINKWKWTKSFDGNYFESQYI